MANGVSIIAHTRTLRVGAHVDDARRQILQLAGIRHFRHQHRIGLGRGNNGEVIDPPAGIEAVDPHHHFAVAEAAIVQRLGDRLARLRLGFRRHRVFEIEDEAVGRQFAGLFQRARVRSGHVKHAAARTDGHRQTPRTNCFKLTDLHVACQ